MGRPSQAQWKKLRKRVLLRDGYRCLQCGSRDELQVDHIAEVQDGGGPELNSLHNLRTLCGKCHRKKTAALRRIRAKTGPITDSDGRPMVPAKLPARLPSSHSRGAVVEQEWAADRSAPFSSAPREPGGCDPMPLRFPPPHPEAVSSDGDAAAAWIEARQAADHGVRASSLRHWQWVVLQRVLERRADGSWCWPVSFVSVPRQQGKSELLAELAAWRVANPDAGDGMPQIVGHCAHTVVLAKLVQSARWMWAEQQGFRVQRMLGDTRITWPDGGVWQTMAKENTYGRSMNMIVADEGWAWESFDFWQAVYPTMAARPDGQAVIFSAANDDARSLPASLMSSRMCATMLWGAPPGADPYDRAVWAASQPYVDGQRLRAMDIAVAGGGVSFASQWLNVWPDQVHGREVWLPEQLWSAARDPRLVVPLRPQVAAVEVAGMSWAVAHAWAADGQVHVTARLVDGPDEAWEAAAGAAAVVCGADLVREPQARALNAAPVGSRQVSQALNGLRTMCGKDLLRWDGDDLADQMRRLKVDESDGKLSVGRKQTSHLVRTAAWAAFNVRTARAEPLLHTG